MGSSTWRPASSDRRRLTVLWTAILGGPLTWLILLQTDYALAYPACADRSNVWLLVPAGIAIVAAVILAAASWRWYRRPDDPPARALLGAVGVAMSVGFLVLILATAIPPLILHPCD
jgi:hypothetical protein